MPGGGANVDDDDVTVSGDVVDIGVHHAGRAR
jgi:hypothetical protein